jgi:hypothetical protein
VGSSSDLPPEVAHPAIILLKALSEALDEVGGGVEVGEDRCAGERYWWRIS